MVERVIMDGFVSWYLLSNISLGQGGVRYTAMELGSGAPNWGGG
jgi:hypothetical protein